MVFAYSLNIFHVSLAKNASVDFRPSNPFLRLPSTLLRAQSTFLDRTLLKSLRVKKFVFFFEFFDCNVH